MMAMRLVGLVMTSVTPDRYVQVRLIDSEMAEILGEVMIGDDRMGSSS